VFGSHLRGSISREWLGVQKKIGRLTGLTLFVGIMLWTSSGVSIVLQIMCDDVTAVFDLQLWPTRIHGIDSLWKNEEQSGTVTIDGELSRNVVFRAVCNILEQVVCGSE
jgi:hypothetical protein